MSIKDHESRMQAMLRKVEALLNTKGCTEAEAQARMAKAQEIVEAYGLDMATVGGNDNKRHDKKRKGGLYSWQRNLWKAVAELNFCHHFAIRGLARGSQYEHRLIGSHANVVATELMAQYLQDTIEKLAQKWAKDNFYKSVFVREAIAYREGMTARISQRLNERRQAMVTEERRKAEERKRDQARNASASTGTELTILDVISTEADFNNDYLQGWEMGTTARRRAEQEARAEAWRREYEAKRAAMTDAEKEAERIANEQRLKKWAEQEAKNQKRRNRTPPKPRYRKPTAEEERMQMGSFWEGHREGGKVGIDTQINKEERKKIA